MEKKASANNEGPKIDTGKLDSILVQIKGTKKFITREDFLKLLDLNDDEKKYIAERLSKSQQNLILKYLQELPDTDFEIQLSRKASMYPHPLPEDENPAAPSPQPSWLEPIQELHKTVLEENKELMKDLAGDLSPLHRKLSALQKRKQSEEIDPDHPFLFCIKRMVYAFGDVKDPDTLACLRLHSFIEDWLKTLLCQDKLNLTVDMLKRMYPAECRRYFEMAKVKSSLSASYGQKPGAEGGKPEQNDQDLQYFNDLKSFDELVPDFENEPAEGPDKAIDELQSEHKVSEPEGVAEGQSFAMLRSEHMSAEDYKDFVASRAVGLLYKGRKVLCKWLSVPKDLANNKTLIELAALILKSALRRITEEAIRKRSPTGMLHIITSPLKAEELEPYIVAELKLIRDKTEKVVKGQNGYKLFARDRKRYVGEEDVVVTKKRGELSMTISKEATERGKESCETAWDKLAPEVRNEYKTRLEAERNIKAYLRNRDEKGDYVPINEYGKFVKKEIEKGNVKKCNNRFFYDVFQKWLKRKKQTTKSSKKPT